MQNGNSIVYNWGIDYAIFGYSSVGSFSFRFDSDLYLVALMLEVLLHELMSKHSYFGGPT